MLNYFSLHFVLSFFFAFASQIVIWILFFRICIPSKRKSWCIVGGSLGGKEEVGEPIFHTCTAIFLDNSFFFLSLPFFEYATSNPTLFHGENVYISAYTHEAETDVDTKSPRTQVSVFISPHQKKKPAFFAKQNLFFLFNSRSFSYDDFYTIFSVLFRGCFSISISICVYRFQRG